MATTSRSDSTSSGPGVSSAGLSLYDRLYVWGRARGGPSFAVARTVAWAGRKARSHPILALVAVLVLAGLIVSAALSSDAPLWAASALFAAVLFSTVAAGFVRFSLKEARHELELENLAVRRRLDAIDQDLGAQPQKLADLEARIAKEGEARLEAARRAEARIDRAESRWRESEGRSAASAQRQQQALREELKTLGHENRTSRRRLDAIDQDLAQQPEKLADLEARIVQEGEARLEAWHRTKSRIDAVESKARQAAEQSAASVERQAEKVRGELAAIVGRLDNGIATQHRIQRAAQRLRRRLEELERRRVEDAQTADVRVREARDILGQRLDELESRARDERDRWSAEADRLGVVERELSLLAASQAELKDLGRSVEATRGQADQLMADAARQQTRLREGLAAQKALQAEVERLAARLKEAGVEVGRLSEGQERLDARVSEAATGQRRTAELAGLSTDIVSALRHIRPLWAKKGERSTVDLEHEAEHGHALLLAMMVEDAKRAPGSLEDALLVEVGTTRESDPTQRSTQKFAVFTGLTKTRFITVDMDPANTAAAEKTIGHLNPRSQAVAEKGETYLAAADEPIDYVYLDAYDFDHGQHSEARQERYRSVLGDEISDERCWEMHQLCAASLITRLRPGGLVVIDDTWLRDGIYVGKGRRAVPLLLAAGFELAGRTERAVALRRRSASV